MDMAEFKLMPMGFIKKYGSYITNLQRYRKDNMLKENRGILDYYAQIKYLKQLMTDEEKMHMKAAFEKSKLPEKVTVEDLMQDEHEYFKRQPRVDPSKLSYNFEQYGKYTQMLAKAKEIDDEKSKRFYKIVKYVQVKQQTDPEDNIVKDFT